MKETPALVNPENDKIALWMLAAFGALTFLAHMLVAGNYGYFRDELYYIADGRHLQAGYVDQPPLLGWLAAVLRVVAGDGLFAIHFLPALACAALVVVTGLIARELGGGRTAQLVAGVAAFFMVDFMASGSLFSMDVLDQLFWSVGALLLARMLRRDAPRQWLLFGLVAALGFLTKLTILFFGFAVALALLATPERRYLRTRWPWIAVGIAAAGLLPYLIWNARNGWPTVDFYRTYRYLHTGPLQFFAGQIALMNPAALPLAVAGVVFYFRRSGARYRLLGWTFVFLYVMLTIARGKPYFLGPAYPILFGAGAVMFEGLRPRGWMAWVRPAYVILLALVGLLLAPAAMPILEPAAFVRIYGGGTNGGDRSLAERGADILPQNLSDRLGWDDLTRSVEQVYASLPPEQRGQACVLASNYGEASALALLGSPGSLPPVISAHNNYFLWGPGACTGRVLITVGYSASDVKAAAIYYSRVTLAATESCYYCVAYERELPILVLSDPKDPDFDIAKLWPSLKHFD